MTGRVDNNFFLAEKHFLVKFSENGENGAFLGTVTSIFTFRKSISTLLVISYLMKFCIARTFFYLYFNFYLYKGVTILHNLMGW